MIEMILDMLSFYLNLFWH